MTIACKLPEGDLKQRRVEIQALLETRRGVTQHSDGIEMQFAFSEETARSLLDFVFFERGCCQSFQYELGFPPPHDVVTLRLRAPAEQVDALRALFYC
jgi:hypothetical protein